MLYSCTRMATVGVVKVLGLRHALAIIVCPLLNPGSATGCRTHGTASIVITFTHSALTVVKLDTAAAAAAVQNCSITDGDPFVARSQTVAVISTAVRHTYTRLVDIGRSLYTERRPFVARTALRACCVTVIHVIAQ